MVSTALAPRELTDADLKRRIEAMGKPGFGLAGATSAQLNMIYLFAQRYALDPILDITLYQGRPWITLDGRLRILQRHPDFKGLRTRPLPASEKEAWGYQPDDLVVEATVVTAQWGDVKARGKVSSIEMQRNTPTGTHPTEMAEKRAIARAARLAFGQDVPDEDDVQVQVVERTNPERVRALASRYEEIFPGDDDDGPYRPTRERDVEDQTRAPAITAPESVSEVPAKPSPAPTPLEKPEPQVTVRSQLGQRLAERVEEAARLEVPFEDCKVPLPAPKEQVVRAIERLEERVEAKKRKLAGEPVEVGQRAF